MIAKDKIETGEGWAKTSDGYVFYRQDDGTYTDGDMWFNSDEELIAYDDGVVFEEPDTEAGMAGP